MKAVRIHEVGGPEVLRYVELDVPDPETGEVQVRVAAAGVNFIDLHHRTGRYPVELPMILGTEAAGTVVQVGPGVDHLSVGDPVAFVLPHRSAEGRGNAGGYAQLVNVPTDFTLRVPDGIELKTAAALMLQGLTAHALATSAYPVQRGDVVLVHSASGGVGQLLTQLCVRAGARVIGVVSTAEKAALARQAGASDVLRYGDGDLAVEARRLSGGAGVDAVYDAVGRDTFDASLASLRVRGTMVLFGQASGQVPPFNPHSLNTRGSLTLVAPSIVHYMRTRAEFERRATDLFGLVEAGNLDVRIDRTFPMSEVADAHRYVEERRTKGKVLLIP
jgi:NADPH:quinone reductase